MQMSAKHIFPFATKSNQVKGKCINKHKESLLQEARLKLSVIGFPNCSSEKRSKTSFL